MLVEVSAAAASSPSAAALHRWLLDDPPDGVVELVPAERSVLVRFDAGRTGPAAVRRHVERVASESATHHPHRPPPAARTVEVPVCYDGPDLDEVAAVTASTTAEVIARHQAPSYTSAFCGFSPGFAYLTGLDPSLHLPRRDEPRTTVPAGSVAIAAGYTAVYPRSSPGGWWLLGRTDLDVWDLERATLDRAGPALLAPGTDVRFVPTGPSVPLAPSPTSRQTDDSDTRPTVVDPQGSGTVLTVLSARPGATVQDLGRSGHAWLGVGRSGAVDRGSLRLANRLVGNAETAACLEVLLGGLAVTCSSPAMVAVTGAPSPLLLDGRPVADGAPIVVSAGATLEVGAPTTGLWTYLAVRGGVDVAPVLGSRATDTLGDLGPVPLRRGHRLPVGDDPGTAVVIDRAPMTAPTPAPITVRTWPGPRHDALDAAGHRQLHSTWWQVAADSNRVGVRLEGPPVRTSRGEMASEGIVRGAVQLPGGGAPIVSGSDHPTTGGYPVVLVVDDDGVDALAQARPGQRVQLSVPRPLPHVAT